MSDDLRTLDAAALQQLQSWVGKSETLSDEINAAPVIAMSSIAMRSRLPDVTFDSQ